MSYCHACGAKMNPEAAFCGACGTAVNTVPFEAQSSRPKASADISPRSVQQKIASLEVSEKWKRKFVLIDKAGGPSLKKIKGLTFGERLKIPGSNIWGFFFGPFYYLAKGMWKKALTYFLITVVVVIALEIVLLSMGVSESKLKIVNVLSFALYAIRGNIDYYKKMVLNDNGWW